MSLKITRVRGDRRSVVAISAWDFRSEGRWFEPGLYHRVDSVDKKLYSTLSLSTQVYKWVSATVRETKQDNEGNPVMD